MQRDEARCLAVLVDAEAQGNSEGQLSRAQDGSLSNLVTPAEGAQTLVVETEVGQPIDSDTEDSMDGEAPSRSDHQDPEDEAVLSKQPRLPPAGISELAVILALGMVNADHGGVQGDTSHILRDGVEKTKAFPKEYLSDHIPASEGKPWSSSNALGTEVTHQSES